MRWILSSILVHGILGFVIGFWICPWIDRKVPTGHAVIDVFDLSNPTQNLGNINSKAPRSVKANPAPESKPTIQEMGTEQVQAAPSRVDVMSSIDKSVVRYGEGDEQKTGSLGDYLQWVTSHNEPPSYPRLSRLKGEQGKTVVQVIVGEAGGAAVRVELHTSSGFDNLDRAALVAVRAWVFPRFHAISSELTILVPFRFALDDKEGA